MKKFLLNAVFVVLGVGAWGVVSTTPHFSIKKWDAKFESILRNTMSQIGLSDNDVLSSVKEIQTENGEQWVVHTLELKKMSAEKFDGLRKGLDGMGAEVERLTGKGGDTLLVKRNGRLYQKIKIGH